MTTRRISEATPQLKAFIDAANLQSRLDPPRLGEVQVVNLSKLTKSFSSAMKDFLGDPNDRQGFLERYDALRSAQGVLPSLVDQCNDYDGSGSMSTPISIPLNIYIRAGMISGSGYVWNALEEVAITRIRRCKICEKVFWAPRINSDFCSLKCRNRYNKKKSRERHGR